MRIRSHIARVIQHGTSFNPQNFAITNATNLHGNSRPNARSVLKQGKYKAILRVGAPVHLGHKNNEKRGAQNDRKREKAGEPLLGGIGIKRAHALLAFAALGLRSREHIKELALRGLVFFQRVKNFLANFLAEIFIAVELVGVLRQHGLQGRAGCF